ncbi:Spore germination protein YaaH [compost metagenome]
MDKMDEIMKSTLLFVIVIVEIIIERMTLMKSIGKLLLCGAIMTGTWAGLQPEHTHAASPTTKIVLDNYPLTFPTEPIIIQGTTMVPFRSIAEALNIKITWDNSSKTITAVKGQGIDSTQVKLAVGKNQATVNGSNVTLAVAPLVTKGNTLIPLSFFSQQFGADVDWNASTRTVSITSPKQRMYTLGFYAIQSFSDADRISTLDSVAFGWSRIDENGDFTLTGKDFKMPQAAGDVTADSLIADATSSRTTPYLMVYSSDTKGELTKVIEDASTRKKVISDIISTATEKKFKGILLDFEGLGLTTDKTKTRNAYTAFVKEIAKEAKGSDLKLSLALHPLNSSYQGYDYKALGQIADEIIIMAYDYTSSKGNPEPIAKVNEGIQLAIKETGSQNLVLGLNMNNENEESVQSLVGLAKRYQLKGVALWRLGLITNNEWQELRETVEFKS